MSRELKEFIATGCFSGYFPVAPATAGSALATLVYWFGPDPGWLGWVIILPVLFFLGVLVSSSTEEVWGEDPGRIVIDEIVGLLVTLAFLPKILLVTLVGFFAFRAFDIVKLPPGGRLENLPGGWGVMADDLVAGVYAYILVRVVLALGIL